MLKPIEAGILWRITAMNIISSNILPSLEWLANDTQPKEIPSVTE